jgi:hypothetical protein
LGVLPEISLFIFLIHLFIEGSKFCLEIPSVHVKTDFSCKLIVLYYLFFWGKP